MLYYVICSHQNRNGMVDVITGMVGVVIGMVSIVMRIGNSCERVVHLE